MISTITLIEIEQPIGTFYIGKINAKKLLKFTETKSRSSGEGVQRDLSKERIQEIANYCLDPDATFPTPIIVSINDVNNEIDLKKNNMGLFDFSIQENIKADVIDGQHRLRGIEKKINDDPDFDIELPVVFMFNLSNEEKAYIFSTINNNQRKVDKSLIFELFDLFEERSPQKTCHMIARSMNSYEGSPFYKKLKMLGKKENEMSTLSQGTFVTLLLEHFTKDEKKDAISIKNHEPLGYDSELCLRKYFIEEKDEIILKILLNYFSAVKDVFPDEWAKPKEFILSKTTGYGALMLAFKEYIKKGEIKKDLSKDFFISYFKKVKEELKNNNKKLTSDDFKSGRAGHKELSEYFINVLDD